MQADVRQTTSGSGYLADHLSALPSGELRRLMRDARSLPLESLLNRHQVTVDVANRRVWRDCYWKGSFARNTPMGWEERLMTPIRPAGPQFAGGRFWKRFDVIRDGVAAGHVVNYGIGALPGRPQVRQLRYPDARRRYVQQGDDVLVLTYLNPPYRIVYDLIKIVDSDHCIGVMHLGRFPDGLDFATFVMTRNNYPFEKMAVPDHDDLFDGDRTHPPTIDEAAGVWQAHVVFLKEPDLALHNQFNPPLFRVAFNGAGPARLFWGPVSLTRDVTVEPSGIRLTGSDGVHHELRALGPETLLGRRVRNGRPGLRYVLTRIGSAR